MSSDNHSIKSNHTATATTTGGGNNNEESSSINTGATGKSSLTGSAKTVPFRRLSLPHTNLEDSTDNNDILYSNHFLPALQVIAHVLVPLRKALIHFHFLCRQQQNPEDTVIKSKIEFQCLATLGQIFQSMMTQPTKELIDSIILSSKNKKKKKPTTTEDDDDDNDSDDDNSDEDDSDDDSDIESKLPPIDPTPFYKILIQCLEKFHKPTKPKDATQALQILLEVLQLSCRQIPVTSHLWSALIDQAGLGLIAKQLTVGQCDLEEDGEILQRTKKDSVILWCPWVLPLQPTLPQALQKACSKTKCKEYDFDSKPYDFEVRIPLWQQSSTQKISSPTTNDSTSNNSNNLDGLIQDWEQKWDSSSWRTTKSLQLTSLTTFLFLGIDRYNKDQQSINTSEVVIPKMLDVSKLCANNTRTSASSQKSTRSRQYELVAGILVDDEEDYVAIIKNFAITDPDDENSWKLMESEEVIPMTESDVLDFLKGEGNNNGNNKSSSNNEKKNGGNNDDDDDDDDDDEGGPCGTVLVYQRCDTGQSSTNEMNQILSDIIISHVSGTLDASPDYYYEEEIIED